MNLVIDFGNSMQKMAVFDKGEQLSVLTQSTIDIADMDAIKRKFNPKYAILSSVVHHDKTIDAYLKQNYSDFICLNANIPLPLDIAYLSKATLGTDRLACAVAARHFFPNRHVLIIQLGSCVTFDFLNSDGVYLGGSISPGLRMRFQALHSFSARLPLIEYEQIDFWTGNNTHNSILSGVINGIIAECNAAVEYYSKTYNDLVVVLTGGDANLFEHTIKYNVHAFDNFVMKGLDVILNYNVEKQECE